MSRVKNIALIIMLSGLLLSLIHCQSFPGDQGPEEEHVSRLLTDVKSVRTQQGEHLAGYLAEYDWNFETRRVFAAFEIQKYEKGERLLLIGRFTGDSVCMSYADQINADFPVFRVLKAEPGTAKKKFALIPLPHMALGKS
jgi:hypothetical protein